MRTSTVLGISISLSAGVILGWLVGNVQPETPKALSQLVAAAPPTITNIPKQEFIHNPDLIRAEKLINSSRPAEALIVLSDLSPNIDLSSKEGKEWTRLLVQAYADTNNASQLIMIYQRIPTALSSNESATLLVAESFINQQKLDDYRSIRRQWLGNETDIPRWTFLDAKEKINSGKPAEAVALLQSHHFEGKNETDRLVRLAALYVVNDPKRAWGYLSEAAQKDSSNPDVFTFKASLGERLKQDNAAAADYITAVQNDPDNPHRRELLADFYIRTGQYPQALKILQETMAEPSLDTIWVKTLFWSRVAKPSSNKWKNADIPEGGLHDFAAYLNGLPEGIFWNEQAFSLLPNPQSYAETVQETFWLKLLAALKKGDEATAKELILNNPFRDRSWSPDLENGIEALITYRLSRRSTEMTPSLSLIPPANVIQNPEQFLSFLSSLSNLPSNQLSNAIPENLDSYLISKEAFVAPFLAAGWTEAAIQLHSDKVFPETYPDWLTMAFTEALKNNRSARVALEFATAQPQSPPLSLLIAEIALSIGQKQTAFSALKEIYTTDSDHGAQAALMLGQFLMDHDNAQDAKKAILAQPSLVENPTARELLARIAIQEGDLKKAESLYQGIEDSSSEAKSFLARQAFANKNWSRARKLTESLVEQYPDNEILLNNLKKIIAEEKKQTK
ncbi:MAG: tetratricopeptide repeat protein [Parachlamydiaceae bacterium]